ncbi:Heterokaryon incompatibility protein 6, OR allele [Madurella mycetomatis]|uniref:Heterokaryon incompatibility protein 6, OR allele n=1 Tax=Madurella mycetomatis TaxID=100816 RepID=A0A175VUS4_9PEZI|nr:Heterokaryon incompatibility protein 6, OR allele [Madurella mycetomatis]
MLTSRVLRLQGIRTTFSNSRPRLLPNFGSPRHQTYASQSINQPKFQYEAPRQRLTFKQKCSVYFLFSATAQFIISFVYEPLRDYGLFDSIAHGTIRRVIPFKKVRGPDKPGSSIYQPITKPNEIRLLVLEPGKPGDELECNLINVQLSWRTKYEALSYTWGDATITRPLPCSGQTINVTASLHNALTDLRLPRSRRYLWVDAVCINQSDNEEKEKQIMLMGQIYKQARQVLIYLGKSDPGVDGAMQDFRWLDWKLTPIHILRYNSRWVSLGPLGVVIMDLLPRMKPIEEKEFDWGPVINLLQRQWFERTWIIQEAVLARRAQVICGNQSVPWAALERVVIAMNIYNGTVKRIPGYKNIDQAVSAVNLMRSARRDAYRHIQMPEFWLLGRFVGRSRQEFTRMLDLIQESRRFAVTNPRDKIYGLLGITKEDTRSEYLVPDYKASPGEVYRRFVLWEILHNNSLRVLGVSSDKEHSAPEFASPSWVPDFTRLDPYHRLTRFDKRATFIASLGSPKPEARVSEDGRVLYLKGRNIDIIKTVAQRSVSQLFDNDISEEERKLLVGTEDVSFSPTWMKEAIAIWQEARKRKTGRAPPLATRDLWVTSKNGIFKAYPKQWTYFLRALICDRTDLGNFATLADLPYVAGVVRAIADDIPLNRLFRKSELPRVQGTVQALIHAAQSRRFASTLSGLAGFVPARAQKGDIVVILYGSHVPCVLRPTADGKYTLVGECYMHGLMWGMGALGLVGRGNEQEFAIV